MHLTLPVFTDFWNTAGIEMVIFDEVYGLSALFYIIQCLVSVSGCASIKKKTCAVVEGRGKPK